MLKTLPHAIPKVASPTEKIPNEGFNSNIEQVQAYLTRHYEFKYNSVTQRLLVKLEMLMSNTIIWKTMSSTAY